MIANEFLTILQNDCNPGIQYNTIQYNYYFKFFKIFIFSVFNDIKKYKICFDL